MNKVIGHNKAVCPYCGCILKYDVFEDGKKRMLNQCRHFYCFRNEYLVSFYTTQEVEAEVENA